MKSEGESSLSGTLKQKHQSAVETHTTTAGEENTHTHTHRQGNTSKVRTGIWRAHIGTHRVGGMQVNLVMKIIIIKKKLIGQKNVL